MENNSFFGKIFGIFKKDKSNDVNSSVENNYEQFNTIQNNESISSGYSFYMRIEDVFTVTGRGTAVVGKIEKGEVRLNEPVKIISYDRIIDTTVFDIEAFRKKLACAKAYENVGLFLSDVTRQDVHAGDLIVKY